MLGFAGFTYYVTIYNSPENRQERVEELEKDVEKTIAKMRHESTRMNEALSKGDDKQGKRAERELRKLEKRLQSQMDKLAKLRMELR